MLYLTSRRDVDRTDANTAVKVYANVPSVTLVVNGKSYGTQKPDEQHIVRWKKVTLNQGANKVEITSPEGLHDEAVWNYNGAAAKP
jgi:beta-galactosidase